eukprot:414702_1
MKSENEIIDNLIINDEHSVSVNDDEQELIDRNMHKISINENTFEPIIESILLNKLARNGELNNICLILDEMIECKYRLSGPVYRDIIDLMGQNGYGQEALQMIDRSILDGIVFSDRIWRYWMLSFAKYGQIESCLLFLDKMDRSNNIRQITTRHFNGLLYSYYQNNDLNGVKKTYEYMINITNQKQEDKTTNYKLIKMKIKPDIKSYHIIAKAYLESNKHEELKYLLDSMEYNNIGLDWKMYSIALQSLLNEKQDIKWDNIQQYISSVISTQKVFPRQPMIDDIISASIQLNVLTEGIKFIHQIFDDPDLRTSTLPTETQLAQFITILFLNTYKNHAYYQMYKGMLPYLTQKYENIYAILNTDIPLKKSKKLTNDQKVLAEKKKYLGNFRFR